MREREWWAAYAAGALSVIVAGGILWMLAGVYQALTR